MTTNQVPDNDTNPIIGSQTRRAMLGIDSAACSNAAVAGWSRRSFLGVLGAIGGGTLAGCVAGGSRGPATDSASIVGDLGAAKRRRPATADAGYTPTPPYTLDAVCELSEDYFLVQNHNIDPAKDKVYAYTRQDGQVEAMVLQDNMVKMMYRDPTQPGGWAVHVLPYPDGVTDAVDVTDMVAGVATTAGAASTRQAQPAVVVYYTVASQPDKLLVAWRWALPFDPSGRSNQFRIQTVAWNPKAGALRIGLSGDYSLFVSALVKSSTAGRADAQLCWSRVTQDGFSGEITAVASGSLTGFDYDPTINGEWAATVQQAGLLTKNFLLFIPSKQNTIDIWVQKVGSTGAMQRWSATAGASALALPETGLVVAGVQSLTQLEQLGWPTALVWTQQATGGNPRLWSLTLNGKAWVWTDLRLPDSITSLPSQIPIVPAVTSRTSQWPDGLLLDIFISLGDTLNVLRQVAQPTAALDASNPAYTPLIPLQPDVQTMTTQPGVSWGNQLIVVTTDGTLEALEKDPLTGWTGAPIHLPSSELLQDSAYRVQLTLSDSWNVGLAGAKMTITASSQAVALVEGHTAGNPNTALLGQTPVTVTTDGQGEVILALLADGLSAPTLTITADKLSDPVTVYPSGAVNDYLTGDTKQQLNYLQPLSADTLQNAKTPQTDTSPAVVVAPGAANPNAAKDAVDNMTGAATAAKNGEKLGKAPGMLGRPDGGRGVHSRRHRHGAGGGLGSGTGVSVSSGQSDINNWSHDVLHGIKKGAAKVSTVTKGLEQDVYVLAVDVADWADHEVTVTVHGIEDAAHVVHAEFNRLGGEIVHAVKWLEAEVIGVFKSAKLLSDHFEEWISDFSGFAATTLASDKTKAVTWLKNEQSDVTTKLTTLAGRYSKTTTLSNMAQNSPGRLGTRRRPSPGGSWPSKTAPPRDSDDDQQPPPHGDWFYNKIKHELAGSGLKIDLSSMPDLKAKVVAFGEKSLAHSDGFEKVFKDDFWMGYLYGVVKQPNDVDGMFVQVLLQKLLMVINDGFDFAENIVAEAFDLLRDLAAYIPKMLSGTTLKNLPILGALMKLIGLGDVSIGRVTNLIFAFPTALVYKIAHGAQAQPFASKAVARRQGLGDEASDLQICAASVMGVWAVFDTVSAAFTAGDEDGGILFSAIDISAPLIVTILTTPATKGGEPFFAPPVSGNAADVMGFLAWVFGAMPAFTAALPLVFEKTIADDAQTREKYAQVTLWVQTVTGVLALVFGMVANSQKDAPKGADYAGAVLNNMSTIAGAGLTDVVKEATVGISVVAAMALTLICGEIGAGVYGADG